MESVKLTVILLIVCTVTNVAQDVCSNGKVILGIARNSADISNAKSGILHNKSPSICDAGVECGHFCMADSSEWNYFEVRRVSRVFFIYCQLRSRPVRLCAAVTTS